MPSQITQKPGEISLPRNRQLVFDQPLVMGVLNVTPDSFSDGQDYLDIKDAVYQAHLMIDEKADIIDIGGESSRPGSEPVSPDEELKRIIPVIKAIREFSDIPISIDTTKADVACQSVANGADIINDISALRFDPDMTEVVADSKTPIVLMHMLGTPKIMQDKPHYKNCVREIKQFLSGRIDYCLNNGISKEQIILDPGIGFGKRLQDNMAIMNGIIELKDLDCPILLGASRKSFISMITGENNHPKTRVGGSIASVIYSLSNGADIIRVHDVKETVEAIKVYLALSEAG